MTNWEPPGWRTKTCDEAWLRDRGILILLLISAISLARSCWKDCSGDTGTDRSRDRHSLPSPCMVRRHGT